MHGSMPFRGSCYDRGVTRKIRPIEFLFFLSRPIIATPSTKLAPPERSVPTCPAGSSKQRLFSIIPAGLRLGTFATALATALSTASCQRQSGTLKPDSAASPPKAPHQGPEKGPIKGPTKNPNDGAQSRADQLQLALQAKGSQSTSVGDVLSGHLRGALQIPARAPGIVHNPGKNIERAYGTVEVIQALIRAGQSLAHRPAEEFMVINDLSFRQGGPIDGHSSHRAGRDVDLYFPLLDPQNRPYPSKLIPLDPQGRGADYFDLQNPDDDIPVRIDLERSWDYLAALLSDGEAFIQRIFIVEHLQRALAQHAKKRGADPALIARFVEVSCQPRKAPHDDHIHIRFYCSFEDLAHGCLDSPPIDAIHQKRLKAAKVRPRVASRAGPAASGYKKQKQRPKAKITTPEQARARAGAMHPSVSAFLDARKVWTQRRLSPQARCR